MKSGSTRKMSFFRSSALQHYETVFLQSFRSSALQRYLIMMRIAIFLGVVFMTLNIYAQNELIVHYNRLKGDYKGWNLWVWNAQDNKEGFEVVPAGTDGYGAVFKFNLKLFNLEGRAIGILPRYKKWESKDGTDRVYQKSAPGRIYIAEGDPRVYLAAGNIHRDRLGFT